MRRRRVPVEQECVEDIIRRLSTSKIEEETSSECLSTFKIEEETSSECWYWCDVFTEEILCRLTADHLEILKTVCKNWLRIISSPYFVGLHLNNAYNQRVLTISCQVPWQHGSSMNMTEYKYNINFDVETKQIPFPPLFRKRIFLRFLGSCDGLLYLFLFGQSIIKIVVYNPSTGKYLLVQPPLEYNNHYTAIHRHWFGRRPSSGEYVLVLWNFRTKVGVYKFSGKHTLEEIQSTPQFPDPESFTSFEERGTLLHGALHWPTKLINRHVICTYHLDNNKYSEISLPGPVQGRFKIGVNTEEGCLFAIFFNSANAKFDEMEMWVMKEYGVERSWAKHANIVDPYYNGAVMSPLGFFPNGDLILDCHGHGLIKYSFNDDKVVHLITHDDVHPKSVAIVCLDSLVSPTIVLSDEFKS